MDSGDESSSEVSSELRRRGIVSKKTFGSDRELLEELGRLAWKVSAFMEDFAEGVEDPDGAGGFSRNPPLELMARMVDLVQKHVPNTAPPKLYPRVLKERPEVGTTRGGLEIGEVLVPPSEMKETFGITPQKVSKRMREGTSPEAALMTLDEVYRAMSANEKLVTGWNWWCAKEGIPPTDDDLFQGPWSASHPNPVLVPIAQIEDLAVKGYPLHQQYPHRAEEDFVQRLFKGRNDACATMLSWLSAFVQQEKIAMPYAAPPTTYGQPSYRVPTFEGYEFHHARKQFLPAEYHLYGGKVSVCDEVQRALRVLTGVRSYEETPLVFRCSSFLDVLGITVFARKRTRSLIRIMDLNWAHYRWAKRANALKDMQALVETYELDVT
jgi:hypothetical protein